MSKPLPVRTAVERIFGIKISTSLPNVDKVAMLEWMLTQPASEISKINDRSETHKILKEYIENNSFTTVKRYSSKEERIYSQFANEYNKVFAIGEFPKNLDMARKLTKQGYDVYFMSNPSDSKSFDFVLRKNGKYIDIEGKAFNGKNSLDHLFEKGAKQSSRIVVDVIGNKNTNYILGNVKDAFERYSELNEIWLLKGQRLIKITRKIFEQKDFLKKARKIWEK